MIFTQAVVSYRPQYMVNVLKFCSPKWLTKWHMQTVQTQIRLLLKELSDQGLHFPLGILRNNSIKSKNLAKKVWNKVFEILGHLP